MPNVRLTRLAVIRIGAGDVEVARAPHRLGGSGIRRSPIAITIAPSGTLTAKIAGQPKPCVSMPPSSAPEEAPSAPIAPHMPTARLRSGPASNELVTIDSVAGESTAPPSPCNARAPSSRPRVSASAQASEDEGEQGGAREEHAAAPEQVGAASAEHQKAGERERVGVHDPLQAAWREAQPVVDRRQRDVHDRDVQDDHELRQADDQQKGGLVRFECAHDWYCGGRLIQVEEKGLSW